jgi:hypothetical protein
MQLQEIPKCNIKNTVSVENELPWYTKIDFISKCTGKFVN